MSSDSKNPEQQNASQASMPIRPLKLQLKLLEKTYHSETDVMSFKFARTDGLNGGKPGEKDKYLNYSAGQYCIVNLGTKEDPEGPLRSFTMASSPTEEDFILITTRIRDTPFKKKLAALDIGSLVNISAPMGKFVLHDDYSKPAVFLSGGIGVTPFRSMIKYATDVELPVNITMFDANRNQANIIFKDDFDTWLRINPKLRIVYTLSEGNTSTEWSGEKGYINKAMVERYLDSRQLDNSVFYICGPPPMLNAMKKLLQEELHVPNGRIKIEEFVGY
jgi:glycine betaine catabolism B